MALSYQKGASLLLSVYFLLMTFKMEAQTNGSVIPKIGDSCPSFLLKNLHYCDKRIARSVEFKGKPLILDFFSVGCKACFMSFPELNRLRQQFEGRVKFILVGKMSPGLQKQYENYKEHYHLDLAVDYDDSTIWNQFGVIRVPHTVWIDSRGIIQHITTPFALTTERINLFLEGKEMSLNVNDNRKDSSYPDRWIGNFDYFFDYKKPLLIGGNGGSDSLFLYRSILSKWDYRCSFWQHPYFNTGNKTRIQEIGVTLGKLFNLAYGDTVDFLTPRYKDEENIPNHYGDWATQPIVESTRKYLFDYDQDSTENMFSYSLILPDSNASTHRMQRMMQRDLQNYFSMYATVEIRKMPCWKIIANGKAYLLKTKGGAPVFEGNFSGFTLQNQPVHSLMLEIWSYFQREPVMIDATGINYHIDLKLDAVMTDINEVRKALQKKGLDLVPGEKEMKVIVVRDLIE
jgi:thiol-disulfide isomerase/thioredoxin